MAKKVTKKKAAKEKDIYAQRRQKKRRKILKQSIWFLLLVMAILVLYQRRDSWIPKLETIGLRHQSYTQGNPEGDGNFPIYLTGGSDYQLGTVSKKLLVLTDSYLNIYETDGSQIAARQHTYGSAMLQTAGDYALVYESGGTHFRLETASKTILEKNLNDPIILGRVSPNGQIAMITAAETCACRLLVFNLKGQQIYERSCVEDLCDITFHPDDGGCYAVGLHTANGVLQSTLHSYSFSTEANLWSSKPLDTLVISVYNTGEGGLFVLGDTEACFMNSQGEVTSSYAYPDTLAKGVFTDDTAVLLLVNTERRTRSLVVLRGDAKLPLVHSYQKEIRDLSIVPDSGTVLLQLWNRIDTITYDGTVVRETPLTDSCDGFLRIGSYLFLHGYDSVSRMDYRNEKT